MEEESYYKNKITDLKEERNLMQLRIDNKNSIIGWGIALIIFLLLIVFIAIVSGESSTINNNGYTIEQVTNATIQMCKALR